MSKQVASGTVFASMFLIGIGLVLARGWLSDLTGFVHSKVGTPDKPTETPATNQPPSGFQGGSAGAPEAGRGGGGGSW